ncbi:MAG TPA: SH3 domain-containing protein [Parachlamydiaceae bacterium]|nr:SH3 domain-containing protein [Parachlamydiaceae bacterium]
MHYSSIFFLFAFTASLQPSCFLNAALNETHETIEHPVSFSPFAGKVTKNKVRMRLQPALDSAVLRELNKEDLLVVISETEDFYGIEAPSEIKAYIYRTFVLDNVVEGSHVNVRLEPNLEAPVIAQLNSGDHVQGEISPINSKWLEIAPPKTTQFYVAKDFIEKIGEPSQVEIILKRRESVSRLLESTYQIAEIELEKPYQQINMDGIFQNLNKVISDKNNLAEQVEKARSILTVLQDRYLQKKIAFLEEKPQNLIITKLQDETLSQNITPGKPKNMITSKMSSWLAQEEKIFLAWSSHNPEHSKQQFYESQKQETTLLHGLIEAYDRSVKNKPGDYILVSSESHLPLAYLYSTQVDLQELLGEKVTLEAVARPNNSFAFPAYFVLKAETP